LELKTADYSINYDENSHYLICKGELRLPGMDEYEPIIQFFNQIIELQPPLVQLDICQLNSLNSSGITVLATFVINVGEKETIAMTAYGLSQSPWQKKALKNFQRLMPNLQIELK
jgi:hypothetical protein